MAYVRWLWILVFGLLPAGCAVYRPLAIEPVKGQAVIAPKFTESFYHYDRDANLYFYMRSSTLDAATGQPVDQVATIRVFWRPRGGVTSLEPTALNATFRYLVMTGDAVGMYEGAGFVRLLSKTGARTFEARVLDGDLRLTQASGGYVDTLGRARIDGYFKATLNDARSLEGMLAAHREFFARSLELGSAAPGSAATMPAPNLP